MATVRQARREFEPDPVEAACICQQAGAHSIVAHLREDRRHIQDKDIFKLKEVVKVKFNLEMSLCPEIISIARKLKPEQVTLVPERRQEITTEGGLHVLKNSARIRKAVDVLAPRNALISLFIAPLKIQIEATKKIGISMIELHTGKYATAPNKQQALRELKKIEEAVCFAQSLGLTVNAGHGLNYENTLAITRIKGIEELNIGHAIVSRAIFVGLKKAVEEMLGIIRRKK